MATNRLNLQIGGNREEPEESLLEETGVSFDVDNLLEELIQENQEEIVEEHGDFLVKALEQQFPPELQFVPTEEAVFIESLSEAIGTPIPKAPEPVLSRQERMAESLTQYNTKTNQSLQEVSPFSDGERIKLLEDAFSQMRRAQPQTLVSGIGASLDSGGGAVWLWDLDDVNIGTPSNGTYPVINDNDVLKFDSATNKWVPGAPTVNSADLPLAGGTMTGDIAFNTGQTFPGTLELTGGTMTGDITFKAGQAFPGTLPLTGGAITGNTTYAGSTAGATNLQTKTSVNALIAAAVTGGFVFKGTTNVTGAAPTPAAGDFYINTVAGTAANTWTGIAGLTVSADQLVIYSGSESRWFVGAVEDNTSFLAKTGGTMTGDIVFAGSQTFPASITFGYLPTTGGIMAGNVTFTEGVLTTKEIIVSQGNEIVIKRGNSNTAVGGLDIKGYGGNDFQAQTDIFSVGYGNGTSTEDYINYKGKTSSTYNIQTKQSVTALINAAVQTNSTSIQTNTANITQNQLDIAELEANSGVLIKSEWDIILSGSSRPGKVMLYTSGLQGGVVAWTDVAFIGFISPDKNGVTYDFSDIPVGANIRLTRSDGSAAGCTFKIGTNSDASIGLFSTESVVSQTGAPANETAYKIDFLPGAPLTIDVIKTITAASADFADFQTRISAL